MSLLDGIVTGIKTVLGLERPTPTQPDTAADRRQQTPVPGKALTPTSFDRAITPKSLTAGGIEGAVRGGGRDPLPGGDSSVPPPTTSTHSQYRHLPGPTTAATVRGAQVRVFDHGAGSGRAALIGSGAQLAVAATGTVPDVAKVSAHNVQRGLDYYARTFGRSGIDGAGTGVDIVVNDRSKGADGREMFQGNGGFYRTPNGDGTTSKAIRFGTGTAYNHASGGVVRQYEMLYADDLTVHELTHGVIDASTGQVGGEADEAGAVNEALADTMAASATRDWRMGEGMYASDSDYTSLRNIANPNDRQAVHALWTHKSQYDQAVRAGTVEEHYASGILSHAAYRMQQRIGGEAGWKAVEQLFYGAITGGQLNDVGFASTATALRTTAARMWGPGSANAGVVDDELRRAGL